MQRVKVGLRHALGLPGVSSTAVMWPGNLGSPAQDYSCPLLLSFQMYIPNHKAVHSSNKYIIG